MYLIQFLVEARPYLGCIIDSDCPAFSKCNGTRCVCYLDYQFNDGLCGKLPLILVINLGVFKK